MSYMEQINKLNSHPKISHINGGSIICNIKIYKLKGHV